MNSNEYGIRDTLKKNARLTGNQQGFKANRAFKSTLFTSSNLHQHKRKKPS